MKLKTGNVCLYPYEDASQIFVYLVLRNTCRPNVTSSDYLPNLLGTLDRDGNAESNRSEGKEVPGKKFLGHFVPGNYGEKVAYVSQN